MKTKIIIGLLASVLLAACQNKPAPMRPAPQLSSDKRSNDSMKTQEAKVVFPYWPYGKFIKTPYINYLAKKSDGC